MMSTNLLISTEIVLLSRGAVWIFLLSECRDTRDSVLRILLLHRHIPVIRRGLRAQNPHAAFHSSPEKQSQIVEFSLMNPFIAQLISHLEIPVWQTQTR